jgi:transcriptional regulator with XRE-family HTH domain
MAKRKRVGDKLQKDLPALLREVRQTAGVSLKEAGPELGVDYTYLSKLEHGVVSPSVDLLSRMVKYYDTDQDKIFLAAGRLPPDVDAIVERHRDEVIVLLRKHFAR